MSKTRLSQFPVYSNEVRENEAYRVDIVYNSSNMYGEEELNAIVYCKRDGLLSKVSKWRKLNTISCTGSYYVENWRYRYVEYAKYAVADYEKWWRKCLKQDDAANEFNKWNGK